MMEDLQLNLDWVERFALAERREEVLASLAAGTKEHFFFSLLHLINTNKAGQHTKEIEKLLDDFGRVYSKGMLYQKAELRHKFVSFANASAAERQDTIQWLIRELNLHFNDAPPRENAQSGQASRAPLHPTVLDQKLIDPFDDKTTTKDISNFTPMAFHRLAKTELNKKQLKELLHSEEANNIENVVQLIKEDIALSKCSFGERAVHAQLSLEQMEELRALKPDIVDSSTFIDLYIAKLNPTDDVDLDRDLEARERYINKLWSFVNGLAGSFNQLKAVVLYHKLDLLRKQGNYDEDLFLQYLAVPRHTTYNHEKAFVNQHDVATLSVGVGLLGGMHSDEKLVKAYLKHFFENEKTTGIKPYQHYIRDTFLERQFAKAKLLSGQITSENAEVMNNMLGGKHQLEALRKKVQIKFSVDNKEYFGHDEQVNLHLKVKNVPTLIVKVFEINTTAFYKDNKREVSEDINLDGLVAQHEEVHNYEEPPMRSHTEAFSFPVLNHRGVYVIEFIGNGQRNRAVIRKGSLRLLAKPSSDGDILSIIDENDSIVKGDADTEIWLDGHILKPDPTTGQVLAPFTSHSSTQVVVITHQGFSSLATYQSSAESYSLHAGFYVDRESLIKLQQATVFVRASLLMNARPVSLDLLEDVTLSITCRDKDGISTNSEVKDFALFENKDSKYAFLVPENARSFSFTLSGHVTKRSPTPDRGDDKAHLSDSSSFTLNEIDDSNLLEDLHLAYYPDGYRIYVLGKSGEPRPGRVIALQLWNIYRTTPFNVTLQTNEDGFAFLGPLQNVYKIECLGEYGKLPKKKWKLRHASFSYPRNIQAPARQPLRVPYLPAQLDREHVSFFQFVDYNTPLHNCFDLMDLDGGFIVIGKDGGLAPGKYNLLLRDDYNHQDTIKIVVVDQQEEQDEKGKSKEGEAQSAQGDSSFVFAKGGRKVFELNHESAAHIADIAILGGDQSEEKGKEINDATGAPSSSQGSERIRIKIGNAKQSTRVHCICNTLLPPWDLLRLQLNSPTADPIQHDIGFSRPRSIFLKKQAISQEHRYILDRKYGTKRRGNMLPSPTLLLNMREATSLGEPPHMQNDMYGNALCAEACMAPCASRRGMEEKRRMMKKCREAEFLAEAQELSSNLDFLGEAAAVVLNLKPDSQGFVELSRQEHLLIGTYLQVAVIEGNSLSFRTITLPPIHPSARSTLSGEGYRLKYKDMCLRSQALDTTKHFTEQRQVSMLADGGSFEVKDLSTALVETYDTLSKAFHLLRTLCSDTATLGQFDWILSWPSLSEKQKLEKYSKFASHELNFFIYKKDKPFFDQYIAQFLRNKKDKTFLDFWLLEEKTWLLHFLPLHHFESLNVVEQILLGTIVKESNPEHAQYIAKYIRDASSLRQKDNAEFSRFVFDTALKGRGLDADTEDYGAEEGRGRRKQSMLRSGSRGGTAFFEGIGEVKQWAERNYWSLQTPQQTGELITPNPFWADYAGHLLVSGSSSSVDAAFVSAHFGEAHRNFAEVMMAMAVLDLPFEKPRHDITYAEGGLRMIAKSPAVVFHKQIKESQVEFSANVLVSQNYIDPRAPLRGDDEEQEFSRYNTNLEFLVGKEYACEVVLTNVGKTTQKLSLLLQIPVGAMPLNKGFFTQSKYLQLAPNSTQQVSYSFYFPKAEGEQCEFQHLPVQVCKNEK
ncbi:MG2 domain-containing protein, partial [Balamuthia mandrillaris]